MSVGTLEASGPLILAVPVALAAGLITFLSPCCLPLVPGYLSYVTGMSGTDIAAREESDAEAAQGEDDPVGAAQAGQVATRVATRAARTTGIAVARRSRSRTLAGCALFVLGFSALFATYGLAFGELGDVLLAHQQVITRVLGGLTVLLGLMLAGAFERFTFAGRILKPSFRPRAGLIGAPLLGIMFGLGWTPCIGPTLQAVLALGFTSGTAVRGAFLAFVYSLGLGIPFLIVALAADRALRLFGFARRHGRSIAIVGGGLLVVLGLLELTGAWLSVTVWLRLHWIAGYNEPF
ncbi:MAG TPA: cytochrome c biogenesis protein CcdA [Streptosporangiaceae bacterium]|nr:cytochrome c biogenesis protein CcdA [Streptosporangiaceae bacterium]